MRPHGTPDLLALRRAGALALSRVAQAGSRFVGQGVLSPLSFADGTGDGYGFGPPSVLPARQACGVGARLVARPAALARARAGYRGPQEVGCATDCWRLGFRACTGCGFPGAAPGDFRALAFDSHTPCGELEYHAFQATAHDPRGDDGDARASRG